MLKLERRHLEELPEPESWTDTGCEASPRCLTCPLPQCKYDDPLAFVRSRRESRDAEIAQRAANTPLPQLCREFHLSPRSILRAIRRAS